MPEIGAYTYLFKADPTRGVYALPCTGVTYLAQVLFWVLGALPIQLSNIL
jgi:hypothetical protein